MDAESKRDEVRVVEGNFSILLDFAGVYAHRVVTHFHAVVTAWFGSTRRTHQVYHAA